MSGNRHNPTPQIPEFTRLVAEAAFLNGSPAITLHDELGPIGRAGRLRRIAHDPQAQLYQQTGQLKVELDWLKKPGPLA